MLFGRRIKNPIKIADKSVTQWKYSTCGYCSTGCSIEVGLNAAGKAVSARGVADAPVNQGKLCIKGIFEHELFNSANRGETPLLREKPIDSYRNVSWDEALDHTAAEIQRIQEKYGRDSVAIVSTGQILTEEFYTLGKLVRGVIGTNMVFIPFHFHECVNQLTLGLLDPYSRQPAFKQCAVKIEPATDQLAAAAANVAARSY